MTRWIAILAAVVVLAWPLPNAVAQKTQLLPPIAGSQQTASPRQSIQAQPLQSQSPTALSDDIVEGQRLADVVAIMRKHGHELHAGFQVGFTGPGAEDKRMVGATLDDEHTDVAVVYNVRDERVLGVHVRFKEHARATKLEHVWLSVRKITLHPDGRYTVHFEKPTPRRPAAERPMSKIPTVGGYREVPAFGGNGQVPPNPIRGDGRF